jgi:hypothetical protein
VKKIMRSSKMIFGPQTVRGRLPFQE